MDQAKYRVEWVKHQMKIREREEAEVEKERVAYASIDWHDFVVVQTVDFQPHEQCMFLLSRFLLNFKCDFLLFFSESATPLLSERRWSSNSGAAES